MPQIWQLAAFGVATVVALVFLGCALAGPAAITDHHPQHSMAERLAMTDHTAEGANESGADEQWLPYADRY